MHNIQDHFPMQVQPSTNGKVFLTLEIDSVHVKAFTTMLDSLSCFFRCVNQKARVAISTSRAEINNNKAAKYYEEYTSAVVDHYKVIMRDKTQNARSAISETLREIKVIYPNACYDSVKEILTKSGTLKKNGFYKKNL